MIRAREVVRALVTSQRSLFEVRAMARGRAGHEIELLDLLGGAVFHVASSARSTVSRSATSPSSG